MCVCKDDQSYVFQTIRLNIICGNTSGISAHIGGCSWLVVQSSINPWIDGSVSSGHILAKNLGAPALQQYLSAPLKLTFNETHSFFPSLLLINVLVIKQLLILNLVSTKLFGHFSLACRLITRFHPYVI